ncbi:DBH [Mytilus coruscus]|uniref:DBH n=1 Tax=Mytilus coruscus TaxID=42192 RepID=A0A6J8C4P5_MYTCO|nr:DBH [Mytilus coruscus]
MPPIDYSYIDKGNFTGNRNEDEAKTIIIPLKASAMNSCTPEQNDTFHLVGTKPIIDNKDITHHILLFGCNEQDSSGLELFYTSNLRQYEAGMSVVGQEYLNIPPRVSNISFRSRCYSACTEIMFPKGVFITRAGYNKLEIHRGNKKIRDNTHEEEYTYDKPVFYEFDHPIKVYPGDEIRTTCTYSSLLSNETIFFGEGTSDEMCYGFITYYPAQNIALSYCTTWKTVEKCKRYMPQFGGIIDGCKWKDFLSGGNEYIGFMMIELAMHCDTSCSSNCTEKVRNLREHECLHGDLGDFMIFKLQRKYPSISLIKDCFRENKSDNVKAYSFCLFLSLALMYFS